MYKRNFNFLASTFVPVPEQTGLCLNFSEVCLVKAHIGTVTFHKNKYFFFFVERNWITRCVSCLFEQI